MKDRRRATIFAIICEVPSKLSAGFQHLSHAGFDRNKPCQRLYSILHVWNTLQFLADNVFNFVKGTIKEKQSLVQPHAQPMQFIIRCIFFFRFIGREPTTWPANNCLQMVCSCVVLSKCDLLQIIFCSCVVVTTLSVKKWRVASGELSESDLNIKQTWWSNDKTIIELGYRKILWFVNVSQINYLPQPSASANNWSARHRQITIFCSASSNNC